MQRGILALQSHPSYLQAAVCAHHRLCQNKCSRHVLPHAKFQTRLSQAFCLLSGDVPMNQIWASITR